MPRTSKYKYDDNIYVRTPTNGKIFLYIDPEWKILYPIAEFLKHLETKTIIGYKYGKKQSMIREYTRYYNHIIIGYELKNKADYINNIIKGVIKYIVIFQNEEICLNDPVSQNLLKISEKYKINLITYSTNDNEYKMKIHNQDLTHETFKYINAVDLTSKIADLKNSLLTKFTESFPEYSLDTLDILPDLDPLLNSKPLLKICLEKIKNTSDQELLKRINNQIKVIDYTTIKYVKINEQKESSEIINNTNNNNTGKKSISNFFKKI